MAPISIDSVAPITLGDLLTQINELTARLQDLPDRLNRMEQLASSGCASCQTKLAPLDSLPARLDRLGANVTRVLSICQPDVRQQSERNKIERLVEELMRARLSLVPEEDLV
uniref:(northern house mosquito) hypothetical protein n=1 Tax=Culex pipiens TaxID=7175 RepID=A0A8D8NMQ2_CULPI